MTQFRLKPNLMVKLDPLCVCIDMQALHVHMHSGDDNMCSVSLQTAAQVLLISSWSSHKHIELELEACASHAMLDWV